MQRGIAPPPPVGSKWHHALVRSDTDTWLDVGWFARSPGKILRSGRTAQTSSSCRTRVGHGGQRGGGRWVTKRTAPEGCQSHPPSLPPSLLRAIGLVTAFMHRPTLSELHPAVSFHSLNHISSHKPSSEIRSWRRVISSRTPASRSSGSSSPRAACPRTPSAARQ